MNYWQTLDWSYDQVRLVLRLRITAFPRSSLFFIQYKLNLYTMRLSQWSRAAEYDSFYSWSSIKRNNDSIIRFKFNRLKIEMTDKDLWICHFFLHWKYHSAPCWIALSTTIAWHELDLISSATITGQSLVCWTKS